MLTIDTIRNGLCDAIHRYAKLDHTPAYVVRDDLLSMTDAQMIGFYHATGKILVWAGGSSHTIYGDARTNWQFRAWHDFHHIISGVCNADHGALGCFEPVAEYAVANHQCRGLPDTLATIVQCEVSGQAKHYADTGTFADNQIAFTLAYLKGKL